MDIVYIKGLRAQAVIGIHDWERGVRRPLVLDLELGSDALRGANSDRIEDALDYAAVSARVLELVEGSHFHLIESLAEHIARVLAAEFGLQWLKLRLSKPGAVPQAEDVGIIIERDWRR